MIYAIMTVVAATGACVLSRNAKNSVIMASLIGCTFIISIICESLGMQKLPLFNGVEDAILAIIINKLAKTKLDMAVYKIFLISILVDILFLLIDCSGVSCDIGVYPIILELLNYTALSIIVYSSSQYNRATKKIRRYIVRIANAI